MTRYVLHVVAMCAGLYAAVSWTFGALTDAGVAGALAGAAVVMAEFAAYCERGRMYKGREAVWARREAITREDIDLRWGPDFYQQINQERLRQYREAERALWPFDVGSPE
jgi:hypothetical protein